MLIKPVSGECNLECRYCFYRGCADHSRGVMSRGTAEKLINAVFEYADTYVSFAFQGGEPTLAGEDFFRFFVSATEKANSKGLPVYWSIQTNGLDPDLGLCRFFAEKGFLVGVSLDGTKELHDLYRRTSDGSESFVRVLRGIESYRTAGADVNVLTVVTGELAGNTEAAWDALADLGLPCLQFILCLENDGIRKHGCAPSVEEYGDFLIAAFDRWKRHIDAEDYISVRQFDNMISAALGYPCELCSSAGQCSNQLVCEADGSVYPCDFYVDGKYLEGNIRDNGISALLNSRGAAKFISERPGVSGDCLRCRWGILCRGGCRREFGSDGKTSYCQSYKRFFAEREAALLQIASLVKKGGIKTGRL